MSTRRTWGPGRPGCQAPFGGGRLCGHWWNTLGGPPGPSCSRPGGGRSPSPHALSRRFRNLSPRSFRAGRNGMSRGGTLVLCRGRRQMSSLSGPQTVSFAQQGRRLGQARCAGRSRDACGLRSLGAQFPPRGLETLRTGGVAGLLLLRLRRVWLAGGRWKVNPGGDVYIGRGSPQWGLRRSIWANPFRMGPGPG